MRSRNAMEPSGRKPSCGDASAAPSCENRGAGVRGVATRQPFTVSCQSNDGRTAMVQRCRCAGTFFDVSRALV